MLTAILLLTQSLAFAAPSATACLNPILSCKATKNEKYIDADLHIKTIEICQFTNKKDGRANLVLSFNGQSEAFIKDHVFSDLTYRFSFSIDGRDIFEISIDDLSWRGNYERYLLDDPFNDLEEKELRVRSSLVCERP